MTTTPLTPSLEELRGRLCERTFSTTSKRRTREWTPPAPGDFAPGVSVLSFDQALTNTGWVVLRADETTVRLLATGTIRTKRRKELTGLPYTFDQLDQIAEELAVIARQHGEANRIVAEYPNVGGGYRTDSSAMAAREIHRVFPDLKLISNTHARSVLGGPKCAKDNSKRELHNAIIEHLDETPARWNEHQRDAAALGLTHLYDMKAHA